MRLSPPLHQRFPFVSSLIEIKLGEICQNKSVVLNDINVDIKPNEFVYLIGKTGSGKSSLLKLLYGELKLSGGTGHIDNFDLNALRKEIFQNCEEPLELSFKTFNY